MTRHKRRSAEEQQAYREQIKRRYPLGRQARCDGERDAIVFNDMEPGEACCGNCGWAFPPEDEAKEGRLICCSTYGEHKQVYRFCKQWVHPKQCSAGVAPPWAEPYTRKRNSQQPLGKER